MIYKKLQFQNYQPSVGTFTEFGRGRSRAGTSTASFAISCGFKKRSNNRDVLLKFSHRREEDEDEEEEEEEEEETKRL